MRILIANRGEIARRIERTAHRLGHETVAVYADPDREAPFVAEATRAVHIGPARLDQSYLDPARLLEAARRSGAHAIHPGYGFLSESADFAKRVVAAGLVWIGPRAEAIEEMGSKIEARRRANAAGVPTIPGFEASQEPARLAKAAAEIGFPVLIKAAAGGGGKGIRIVHAASEFTAALSEATVEAERSFGDASVIVERYVERARHVEVQIVGDKHGHVIDLGTRECSVQRRYQKLLEEAPAPNLRAATRSGLRSAARKLASAIGYDSLGTVEFVVDDATGEYFFLEMNTRLQVEHPVTEEITGLDLVELQLRSAEGDVLPLTQDEVQFRGHAFEVRINAEDASADFAPQTGIVTSLRVPPGVRFETGIEQGSVVTPHYDPMLAKLISHGPDRETARRRLARALDELLIGGLVTNTGFQRWLLEQTPVVEGRVTTRLLEEVAFAPASLERVDDEEATNAAHESPPDPVAWAGRAWLAALATSHGSDAWRSLRSFRSTPHRPTLAVPVVDRWGTVHEVVVDDEVGVLASDRPSQAASHLEVMLDGTTRRIPVAVDLAARVVCLNRAGETHTFRIPARSESWAPGDREGHGVAGATVSPFPAIVTETPVRPGDEVAAGDVVIVIEAMKMLHSLTATGAGRVEEVRVVVGDSVESGQVLITYVAEATEATESPGKG